MHIILAGQIKEAIRWAEGISVNSKFHSNATKDKREWRSRSQSVVKIKKQKQKQMEKICVAVRVRPSISQDSVNGSFWKVEENRISLHKIHGTPLSGSSYAFGKLSEQIIIISFSCFFVYFSLIFQFQFSNFSDHIFDETSTNASVYELLTKDIILAALDGFNGIQIQILSF